MREILTRILWRRLAAISLVLLALAALAAGALFAFGEWRNRQAVKFAASIVAENSPIAELATRRVVWRVLHVGSTVSRDTVRDTVYTIKAGYDLAQAEPPAVDLKAKTVTLRLPPPKILSVDHFLQRTSVERKTLVARVFGAEGDDGAADREDAVRLAADCDKYGLLSSDDLRESLIAVIGDRLREVSGFTLEVRDGRDLPAKVLFNAYFEEKDVPFRLP